MRRYRAVALGASLKQFLSGVYSLALVLMSHFPVPHLETLWCALVHCVIRPLGINL
jgi:hypothetical protein